MVQAVRILHKPLADESSSSGLGQDKAVSFIELMYPNTPLVAYAKKMEASDYKNVAFHVAGVKKDITHIIQLGEDNNVDLTVAKTMYGNLEEVEKLKGDGVDVTSIIGGNVLFILITGKTLQLLTMFLSIVYFSCAKQSWT